jgi:alkaline phosphatase D
MLFTHWLLWIFFKLAAPLSASDDLVQAGPMLGYSEKREVMIWMQTTRSASVQIKYWGKEKSKEPKWSDPIMTSKENDFIAHVVIGDLDPGTRYDYEVLINNTPTAHPYALSFQTQTLWEWRTDPPDFAAAFGSCAYVNEELYDRPGKPYGSHYEIFQSIAQLKPDLMLWLGDNTYLREVDWNSGSGILHRYRHTRSLRELQPLLAATHHYAIWDDHDYGPNDSDRGFGRKDQTLNAFKLFWANPLYGTAKTPGVFFQFAWNDVDFFMLDDRFYRAPDDLQDGPDKPFLGKEQMQWLKDALLRSLGSFKIIVCGSQVLNDSTKMECYGRYKFERDELLGYIKKYAIPGVLFLSGDRHHAELLKIDDANFYPLYDFTASPFTAGLSVMAEEANLTSRVPGTFVGDHHNFGMLRFSGKKNERKLTMECYDESGKLLWNFAVNQKDLRLKTK